VKGWDCYEAGDKSLLALARSTCCCLLLGLSAGAHSGPLVELLARARADDPTYLAAQRQSEAAAEAQVQARALWLPNVAFTVSNGSNQQDVRKSPGQGLYKTGQVDYRARDYALVLSQALVNAGHLVAGRQAQVRLLQVEYELNSQEQDLLYRVA
jgi:outer membrane protein TolC